MVAEVCSRFDAVERGKDREEPEVGGGGSVVGVIVVVVIEFVVFSEGGRSDAVIGFRVGACLVADL